MKILPAMLAVLLALSALAGWAGKRASDSKARAKARHYYREAVVAKVEGRIPESYEYFKKAYQTDTTYEEAALAYAMGRVTLDYDTMRTTTELFRSLGMMRPAIDKYPGEVYESLYYGYIASLLDTIPETIRVYEQLYEHNPTSSGVLLELAKFHAMQRNFPKAIEALDRYQVEAGPSMELTGRKSAFYMQMKDTAGALREVDALIEHNPREVQYVLLKGSLYGLMGRDSLEYDMYEKAEAMAPDNGAVKLALADYYNHKGDSVAYDKKTYEALIAEDFDLEQKLALVSEYVAAGTVYKRNTQRSDTLFRILEEQYPHEAKVLNLASRYYAMQKDYDKAIEKAEYAIDLDPANEDNYSILLTLLNSSKRYGDGKDVYRRAEKYTKPGDRLKMIYGVTSYFAKDFPEAYRMYTELLRDINPGLGGDSILNSKGLRASLGYDDLFKAADYYTMRADMNIEAGDTLQAFRDYKSSLFLYPSNANTMNNLAYNMTLHGGDLAEAQRLSEGSMKLEPRNSTYMDTYAWILFKSGDVADARHHQIRALGFAMLEYEDNEGRSSRIEAPDSVRDIKIALLDDVLSGKPLSVESPLPEDLSDLEGGSPSDDAILSFIVKLDEESVLPSEYYDHLAQILAKNGESSLAETFRKKAAKAKQREDRKKEEEDEM